MKRFDSEAIRLRLLERMRVKLDWALLSENGTISALLDTFADSQAELARYLEYNLGEKKWKTAQNLSSLTTMLPLIGRKTKRKRSAISYVVVSHTDASKQSRLNNLGRTFFDLDNASNYDNIELDVNASFRETQALVPWTYPEPYVIPRGTRFIASNGTEYVATEAVSARSLLEPYSVIESDDIKKAKFVDDGGWEGIKYLKVPVIQGKITTTVLGIAKGDRYESLLLSSAFCENAGNSISRAFLRVFVNTTPSIPENKEEWVLVPNILLASSLDRVFEVTNTADYSGVIFKFGDGITGQRLPAGAQVTLEYLETLGEDGNLDKKYQITDIIFPENVAMVDPRSGQQTKFLSATNTNAILGGKSEESGETLRNEAPLEYLRYYGIATTAAYESQINTYSQVGLDKVKVFSGNREELVSFLEASDELELADQVATSSQNVLYLTAIGADGEVIENAEERLLEPVIKAIGDLKAPSDSLAYIDPNFVRLRFNVTVFSDSTDQSDESIRLIEKQALYDRYSIFNMNFRQPFYSSEFISLAQTFPFVDSIDGFVEAIADLNFTEEDLEIIDTTNDANESLRLYKLHFQFDKMYGRTPFTKGLKNYREGSPYLLKVQVKFKNNSTYAALWNRTFLLYDNRAAVDLENGSTYIPSVDEAQSLFADGTSIATIEYGSGTLSKPDERISNDDNTLEERMVRLGQYPLFDKITSLRTVNALVKPFDRSPYEIRPYDVNTKGENIRYTQGQVSEALRVPVGGESTSSLYYKTDTRFVDYASISFDDDSWDDITSESFGKGTITLPASYFNFTNVNTVAELVSAMKNFVDINVYGVPRSNDLIPQDWNEIIAVKDEDIIVERERSFNEDSRS